MNLFVFISSLYVISCNISSFCSLNPAHIPWMMALMVMTPIPSFEGYFTKRGADWAAVEGGGSSCQIYRVHFSFCM